MDSLDLSQYSPEYQQLIAEQLKRKKIAEAMQAMAMRGPTMPQQIGPQAAKLSPLAALAPVLQGLLSAKMGSAADEQIGGIQKRADTDTQTSIAKLLQPQGGMPAQAGNNPSAFIPEQAPQPLKSDAQPIAMALASRDPRFAAYAKTLQAQLAAREKQARDEALKKAELAATSVKDVDPAAAINIARTGEIPTNYQVPSIPGPQISQLPGPNGQPIPIVTTTNRKGEQAVHGLGGMVNNINLPGKEGELNLKREQEDLETKQNAAKVALENIGNSQRIRNLLRDGANVGGGASVKQMAAKFAQSFGIDVPSAGLTDELKSQLGERLLKSAKLLGSNPSEGDAKRINDIVGSIDTDPSALAKLSALVEAKAHKDLGDFSDFLSIKRSDPKAADFYKTADVGIRQPEGVNGTLPYKLLAAQSMVQYGMDQARAAKLAGIKPEDMPTPDSEMSFGLNALVGKPASKTSAGQKPPGMSQKDWDELQSLRQWAAERK